MALRIVTDSTSDIRGEEIKKLGVEIIPLNVIFSNKNYMDGVDLDPAAFYSLLQSEKEFPRTSQPAPGEFMKVFADAKEKGDTVLYIGVSSGLSGTFGSARIAKEEIGYPNVFLFDSLESIQALHLMVQIAAKRRDEGKTVEEIMSEMEYLRSHIRIVSAIDTLTYLRKGGRLSSAAAFIGNIMGLKIMVDLDKEGKIRVYGKCLGLRMAIRLLTLEVKNDPPLQDYPLSFGYTDSPESLNVFKGKVAEAIGERPSYTSQIGPAIGSHIGPGGFDLAYVSSKDRK